MTLDDSTQEITQEVATIDTGDKRLNQRASTLIEALAANPQVSINAACQGWKDTWKSVWRIVKKDEPLPDKPPPLGEFLRLLAELGGYNNRRHDGPPASHLERHPPHDRLRPSLAGLRPRGRGGKGRYV